jgi:hypothetical protein
MDKDILIRCSVILVFTTVVILSCMYADAKTINLVCIVGFIFILGVTLTLDRRKRKRKEEKLKRDN